MWTVYKDPADYPPGTFVARRWVHGVGRYAPTSDVLQHTDLEGLRQAVRQHGTVCVLPRNPGNDPVILEVWV